MFETHYEIIDCKNDLLDGRRQRVRANGALSVWESVKSGCHQNTILGPTCVRPNSEYGIQAMSLCSKYEVDMLEQVQRLD